MTNRMQNRIEKVEAKIGKDSGRVHITYTLDNAETGADALRKLGIVPGDNDIHFHINFVSPNAKAAT